MSATMPPGRDAFREALLEASELRKLVAEQKELDDKLAQWRKDMERIIERGRRARNT